MMTPQEVSEKTFVKAIFGGYDMETVDEFLEPLTEDYIKLYKENAVLKSKMKVLVESVEEYRQLEDTARKTLFTAQKTADDLLAETERKCAQMMSNAESVARAKVEGLKEEIIFEEARLSKARQAAGAYLERLKEISRQQIETIEGIAELRLQPPEGDKRRAYDELLEEPQGETAPSGDEMETVQASGADDFAQDTKVLPSILNDDSAARAARFEAVDADDELDEEESPEPKPKFEFIDLQFGKDYDPISK